MSKTKFKTYFSFQDTVDMWTILYCIASWQIFFKINLLFIKNVSVFQILNRN